MHKGGTAKGYCGTHHLWNVLLCNLLLHCQPMTAVLLDCGVMCCFLRSFNLLHSVNQVLCK